MHVRNYVLGIIALSALGSAACDSPGGSTFIEPDTAAQPDGDRPDEGDPEIVATETIAPDTTPHEVEEVVAPETLTPDTPTEVSAGTPHILELATNVTRLTQNQSVVISAIVTDADGIDDLIGGTLRDAAGGTYGSFATAAAEGAYSMTVSWSQMNAMAPITFDRTASRTLIAEFFDQAGHRSSRELVLSLHCDDGAACEGNCGALLCDGRCLPPYAHLSDEGNCGSCGNTCAIGGDCDGGACTCHGTVCDGHCRATTSDRAHCGGCNIACNADEPCFDSQCLCTATSCGLGALCLDGGCARVGGVRLVDGVMTPSVAFGKLEVNLGDAWLTACPRSLPDTLGYVVCSQLGMPFLSADTRPAAATLGVSCDGDEADLGACSLDQGSCEQALMVWCGSVGR